MTEQDKAPKIHAAMIAVMRDVGAIGKDQKNQQQGYKFRGIDDIYNHLQKIKAKQGVYELPEVLDDRTEERQTKNGSALIYRILKIRYTFYAEDGSSVQATVIGEGMDSGDKASNKAMSVAHKYTLIQAYNIPTFELPDPEFESPEGKHGLQPSHRQTKSKPVANVPRAQEIKRTPSIFTGSPEQQQTIAKILRAEKVPEHLWDSICDLLQGKPSTELKNAIAAARAAETIPTNQPKEEPCEH